MPTVQEIKKFLKQHKYVVSISAKENGCEAVFPDRKSKPTLDTNIATFTYNDGIMTCNDSSGHIPEYAFRLLTSCLILKWCFQIGYQSKYIVLFDKDGKELPETSDILEILPRPEDEEEREKDSNLIGIFCEAWPAAFPDVYNEVA